MTLQLDYGYEHVYLSKPLTGAVETAVTAANAVLSGLTVTGGDVTVGGQAVTLHDLADQCKVITPQLRRNESDVTTVNAFARRVLPTIPGYEIQGDFYGDDDDDGVYGVIVKNEAGTRLLRIEYPDGDDQSFTAVVRITNVNRQPRADDAGAVMY